MSISSQVPRLSVIVPCHNAAATLDLQLEALATQQDAPPFEVIILDNLSTDDLDHIVDAWRDRVAGLRTVRATGARGASYARNVGASHARGDRLLFCDADDVVSAWWVAQGDRTFEHADLWSGSAIPIPDKEFRPAVTAIRARFGDSPEWASPLDHQYTDYPILMGGDFGVTRDAFVALGGFDQSLASAGEYNDFAIRARRAGHRIPVSKTVRIGYRIRTDAAASARQPFHAARAHALTATRYGLWATSPFPRWWVLFIRCAASFARMALVPRTRDWTGLWARFAIARGLAIGTIQYRLFRRMPPRAIGCGLTRVEQ